MITNFHPQPDRQPQTPFLRTTKIERENIALASKYASRIDSRAREINDFGLIQKMTDTVIRRDPARAALVLQAVADRVEGRRVSWQEVETMIAEEEGMLQ